MLLSSSSGLSQVINGGFEDWNNGSPVGWTTRGVRDTAAHSGKYCFTYQENLTSFSTSTFFLFDTIEGMSNGIVIPKQAKYLRFWYRLAQNGAVAEDGGYTIFRNGKKDRFSINVLPPTDGQWKEYTFYVGDGQDSVGEYTIFFGMGTHVSGGTGSISFSIDDVRFDTSEVSSVSCISSPLALTIAVYPNPIISEVSIDYTSVLSTSIHSAVYDLNGKLLYELPVINSIITPLVQADFSSLPNGEYFLRSFFDKQSLTTVIKIIR